MNVGTSYKRTTLPGPYDAIVIGSGIGGLATAALLATRAHKRVLVLERHYTAGGFTHSFRRPGYDWDVGVHYVGDMARGSLLRRAMDELTGGALHWADLGEVYDRIVIGDDAYDYVRGRAAFRDRMVSYFPGEARAIDAYLAAVRSAARSSMLYFADKAVPAPISAVLGPLLRRKFLGHARRTVRDVLAGLTNDVRLRAVLAGQWGDYGLPPSQGSFGIHALVTDHYREGAYYPVGGAARIAATIEPVIEAAGGLVVTNAEVEQILVEHDRAVGVRLTDGNELRAPLVISDAGARLTAGKLLPDEVAARHGLRERTARIEPSASHVSLYLGLRGDAATLGLPKHNLWCYRDDDHDRAIERFLADPSGPPPVSFISFPSARDPQFAARHPGHATIEVVSFAPYAWFAPWQDARWKKRGDEYEAKKAQLTERLLESLYHHVPAARGAVDHCELSTPLSTRHFAAHPHGEIYGLAHTPARFEQKWLRPRTPIRGLYMTGADVCSAGVAGAMMGGVMCASVVLGRNLIGAIARGRAPESAHAVAT